MIRLKIFDLTLTVVRKILFVFNEICTLNLTQYNTKQAFELRSSYLPRFNSNETADHICYSSISTVSRCIM